MAPRRGLGRNLARSGAAVNDYGAMERYKYLSIGTDLCLRKSGASVRPSASRALHGRLDSPYERRHQLPIPLSGWWMVADAGVLQEPAGILHPVDPDGLDLHPLEADFLEQRPEFGLLERARQASHPKPEEAANS